MRTRLLTPFALVAALGSASVAVTALAQQAPRPAARPRQPAPSAAPSAPAPTAAPEPPPPPPPPPPEPVAPPPPPAMQLSVSAALNGSLATLDCGDSPAPSPLARLARSFAAAGPSLRVDAGDLFGSGALARFAATERDANELAAAVASMGLKALAVGHRDLSADRTAFVNAARAFRERSLPYVLSNLQCSGAATALCDVVNDQGDEPLIFNTPVGRIAFIAAMSPSNLTRVARNLREGLTLTDPEAAVRAAASRAREAGANFVVVAYDAAGGSELSDSLDLAGRFRPGSNGPDVLLVHDIDDRITTARGARESVPVIATVPGDVLAVTPADLRTRPVEPGDAPVPEVVNNYSRELTRAVCGMYNRPLPGGRLTAPLDRDGFSNLVGDVMRDVSRSEISVLNRGFVSRAANFPFREGITGLDVFMALPYENQLRVAMVPGSVLTTFVQSSRASRFLVRGVTTEGGVKVNGRAIDPQQNYRVITNQFIAEGGDGGVADTIQWQPYGEDSLNDEVFAFLSQTRTAPAPEAPLDPAQRTRWTLRASTELLFGVVDINNPNTAALTDTLLARAPAMNIRAEGQVRADADHPGYTWENQLLLRYGVAAAGMIGMPLPSLAENADLIQLRSNAVFRRFGRTAPAWYVPLPYAEVYLESEFSQPMTRTFHHLELRPSIGGRFNLLERLSIYGGAAMQAELLVTNPLMQLTPPGPNPVFSMTAGYQLRPWPIVPIGRRSMEIESNLDAVFRDPLSGRNGSGTQLRGRVKLSIPIFDIISITASYDLFLRTVLADNAMGTQQDFLAFAQDLQVGVKFDIARAVQAFTF